MKPILVASLVAALIAGFIGAATALVLTGREHAATVAAEQRAVAEERVAAVAAPVLVAEDANGLRDQIALLADQIDALRAELDTLREGLARQAAPSAVEAAPIGVEQLAAVQRDAVVQILQEERDREQLKREEERKQREQQAIVDRAARIAKELGLGAADERKLVDFMGVAVTKRDDLFRGTRDGGFDRDTMRKNFDEYRTWAETELNNTFGSNLGAQIMQANRDWGGGGGGPPWQGQSGSNGQSFGGGSSNSRPSRGQ